EAPAPLLQRSVKPAGTHPSQPDKLRRRLVRRAESDKMNTALYHALNQNGIEIPFPQRDVRLITNGLETKGEGS
ncbi:MAG: hypothetical protein DWQ04_13150, partial [Chloroflexi bacterium]